MPRICGVFDANVYRSLSEARFQSLRDAERRVSARAIASRFTALELIAAAGSADPKRRNASVAALKRLAEHVRRTDGRRTIFDFTVEPSRQVGASLLGRRFPRDLEEETTLARLVGAISEDALLVNSSVREKVAKVAEAVSNHELRFARQIDEALHALSNQLPSLATDDAESRRRELRERLASGERQRILAHSILSDADGAQGAEDSKIKESDVSRAMDVFCLPIAIYERLVKAAVLEGASITKKKRANGLWDFLFSFSVSMGAELKGIPIVLITDDGAMLECAKEVGMKERLMSLQSYLDLIESAETIARVFHKS